MKTPVLQAFKHATLLKEISTQVFACNIAKFLRTACFYKTPLGVGSSIYFMIASFLQLMPQNTAKHWNDWWNGMNQTFIRRRAVVKLAKQGQDFEENKFQSEMNLA